VADTGRLENRNTSSTACAARARIGLDERPELVRMVQDNQTPLPTVGPSSVASDKRGLQVQEQFSIAFMSASRSPATGPCRRDEVVARLCRLGGHQFGEIGVKRLAPLIGARFLLPCRMD